jgi:hypothetical protein
MIEEILLFGVIGMSFLLGYAIGQFKTEIKFRGAKSV